MSAQIEIGELNCRLLNPRKMTVRVESGILVKTSDGKSASEYGGAGFYGEDHNPDEHDGVVIEKLRHNFESCDMLVGEAEAKIEENIELTEGSAANEIIYADINIFVDEIKPLYNKAVVKFTSDVKLLYNSVEDKTEYFKITKKIPSTQIVEVDDLDEKYECICKINLSSLKTDIDIDQYGENKIINIDFITQIELTAFKNNEHEAVIDAYSPKFENTVHNESVKVQRYKGIYREKQFIEDSIVLEDASIEEVMDVTGIVVITNSVINESVITVNNSAELSVMVRSGDGEIQNLDCSIPIKTEINTGEKIINGNADIIGFISNVEAVVESGKLNVKVTASYECIVFENDSRNIVKAVMIDSEKPKSARKDSQMIIYYPQKGENLWSIAKKYDSQVSKIMRYNKCDNQNISDRKIIVVPKV
jgi:LysM repeat protein